MDTMDELIGKNFGPYKILDKVGEGGMAVVYRAYQESLGRYAAIKVLRADLARDEEFVARFRREALAVAQLNHPNILHVYDAGVAQGVYYIVMGFVEGGSLKDLIAQGSIDPAYAASIGAQLADALEYAHKQGIIHRDVKPSNVLMTRDGRPMLTDFGIAKALYESAALTRTGASIGTPEYMAPEQIQGQPVDGRTDIYALGIVLYEMVTGWAPFSTPTPVATLYKQVNEPPPPLHQVNVNAPDWLEGVVSKALAKRPEGRYQHAADLAAALRSRSVAGAPPVGAAVAPSAAEGRPASKGAGSSQPEGGAAASMPAPAPIPGAKPATKRRESGVASQPAIPAQEAGGKRGRSVPILIGAIAFLVIALAAGGAYLAFGGKGDKGEDVAGVITVVVVPGETAETVLPTEVLSLPTPVIIVASSTPQPSDTPAPAATNTQPPAATNTQPPTATNTQAPTATNTPKPTPKATATKKPPTPKAYPPPILTDPPVGANCYRQGGCTYTWTWSRSLAANEYFQVQLIGPGNEHRGIHPPTKGYSFTSDESTYWIVTGWCNPDYFCNLKWTVAVIQWDGKDPSKIGRTLIEAAPRDVTL
ncbi:MAG: protein kinase [Anaerolineae bacterium]|nr:protein kinase [Anaerolineae bacterium]